MDWSESGYLALSALNVKDGYIDFSQDVHYGNQALYDKWMNGNELHKGQVLFTTEAPMGNVAQVPDNKRYILSQRTVAFDVKEDVITENFLATLLRSPVVLNTFTSLSSGGTAKGISQKSLAGVDIKVPMDLREQTLLADYFRNIDNLITLHQRKYDKLQILKKSMLEKMFPKNGSSVPEIRFKGFTDAWEQRKLENYLAVSSDKNTSDIYNKADVLSVSGDYGIVNQIEFQGRSFAGASVSNYGVVQTGDVVYTKSPLNSNPYGIIKTNKGRPGIVSTLYAVYHPRENAFPNFIQVYFEQHARMNNYMHPLVNKGAKNDMKVSAENALKGFVCFPSYEEQETISAFFQQLYNLITLHQRELEKLQNIKKSMLEKMFV